MQLSGQALQLSASDLVGYVNCRYLTQLDLKVARGTLLKPAYSTTARSAAATPGGRLHLEPRGVVEIKGKDPMKPSSCLASGEPAGTTEAEVVVGAPSKHIPGSSAGGGDRVVTFSMVPGHERWAGYSGCESLGHSPPRPSRSRT